MAYEAGQLGTMNSYDLNQDGSISGQEIQAVLDEQRKLQAEIQKFVLDNTDVVQDIIMRMRGFEWNAESQKYDRLGEAKCNNEGISQVYKWLRPYSSKNLLLTKFKDTEINPFMEFTAARISRHIFEQVEKYDIKNLSDAEEIIWTTCDFIEFTMRRSIDAGERDAMKATNRRIEQITNSQQGGRGFGKSLTGIFGG